MKICFTISAFSVWLFNVSLKCRAKRNSCINCRFILDEQFFFFFYYSNKNEDTDLNKVNVLRSLCDFKKTGKISLTGVKPD